MTFASFLDTVGPSGQLTDLYADSSEKNGQYNSAHTKYQSVREYSTGLAIKAKTLELDIEFWGAGSSLGIVTFFAT